MFLPAVVRAVPPDMVLYLVEDPEFRYEDFVPRGEQAPPIMRAQVWRKRIQVHADVFNGWIPRGLHAPMSGVEPSFPVAFIDSVAWCVQDYSWEDHGFSLVNRLLPDMGQFLDEKFQVHTHFNQYNLTETLGTTVPNRF